MTAHFCSGLSHLKLNSRCTRDWLLYRFAGHDLAAAGGDFCCTWDSTVCFLQFMSALQLEDALNKLHAMGLAHLDLTPASVLRARAQPGA